MDQVRLISISLAKPNVILDQTLVCTGQSQRQCGRNNPKLLDDGTHLTSQDFFYLPPRTTWYSAVVRLVYL
jgi:hypothetical protein